MISTVSHAGKSQITSLAPFSRLALGAGVSLMGVNMQAATNVNRYLNLRGTGNYFTYTVNGITVNSSGGANGINISGKLDFNSAGVSLDYYPFPKHGFRLSPGAILNNKNQVTASGVAAGGNSFTLGSQTYYSDSVDPLNIHASLGLNTHQQAFSFTTGWANMISRKRGHWSFPFELGAVFTGVPTIGLTLTGNACISQADSADNGPSCVNMATNSTAQANLANQKAKYQNDLSPMKVYPIVSFGVARNFRIR